MDKKPYLIRAIYDWCIDNKNTPYVISLVVTSDKDGDGCEADKELVDADIVISQPFFPYYLTRDKMQTAPNLKMAITAGIGSDHVDLQAAMERKVEILQYRHLLILCQPHIPLHPYQK